jgi:hypothetical protein
VNQRNAGRHRIGLGRQRQREQVGADGEQHVVLVEELARIRCGPRDLTAEQRVRTRKRSRVRYELEIDRRAEQFRQLDQRRVRAALCHDVAGHDDRPLRLRQDRGSGFDRVAVAADVRRNSRRRHQVEIGVRQQNIAGQRKEHRPGRWRQRRLGRTMHDARQVGEPMHLRGPFHQRSRDRRQVRHQDRLGDVEGLLVLARRDQDRRARLLRVVEHAHGVAQPRRGVEVAHRKFPGCLRVAVRHRHDGRLLQAEDVANFAFGRERIHQCQLGGAGIAEHEFHALLLEQFEERMLAGHHGHRVISCRT